ncbi:MAG: DUF1553 domain-containing protein [Gemmataceae bacterium]
MRGSAPTHPELLDWLATEFQRNDGRIKPLIKTILMSATYRQSSLATPVTLSADPDNRWFSRMNRKRLEGEIVMMDFECVRSHESQTGWSRREARFRTS